jgi:4-amino-4-deoxy-L-arabinose transferase-like glycosyltransferase
MATGGTFAAPTGKRFLIGLAIVGGVALVLRLVHAGLLLGSPLGETLTLDAAYYHTTAQHLLGSLPDADLGGPSFMNLGYPYFLALVYRLFGVQVVAALILQAVLGALTAVLTALIVRRLMLGERAALVAGGIYALYAPAIFYDGLLLTPSLVNLLLAVALFGTAGLLGSGKLRYAMLAGLALGLAILLRANAILLVPLLGLLMMLGPRRSSGLVLRARLVPAVVLLVAAVVFPLPVTFYNGFAHGEWAPVSANGGMNFWSGNHREASGLYGGTGLVESQNAEEERRVFLAEARRRTGNPDLSLADSSWFWVQEGVKEIRAAPGRWVGLEGRKFAMYWSRHEAKTNVSRAFIEDFSPLLGLNPIGFGVLGVAGVGGLVYLFAAGRRRAAWLGAAPVVASLSTCLLFFVSGEYRHPASIGLCVGAGVLVDVAFRLAALRRSPSLRPARRMVEKRLVPAAVASVLILPLSIRTQQADWFHPFLDYSNYARAISTAGVEGRPSGIAEFQRAIALLDRAGGRPESDKILFLMDARLWVYYLAAVDLKDPDFAARTVEAAGRLVLRLSPEPTGYSESFLRHLPMTITSRMRSLARQRFVETVPGLARDVALLGGNDYREINEYFAAADLNGARTFVEAALERWPSHPGLQAAMGRVYLQLGREAEGLEWLKRSCAGWPPVPECAYYGAVYNAARGDFDRAIAACREALRRDPNYRPAQQLLSRLSE